MMVPSTQSLQKGQNTWHSSHVRLQPCTWLSLDTITLTAGAVCSSTCPGADWGRLRLRIGGAFDLRVGMPLASDWGCLWPRNGGAFDLGMGAPLTSGSGHCCARGAVGSLRWAHLGPPGLSEVAACGFPAADGAEASGAEAGVCGGVARRPQQPREKALQLHLVLVPQIRGILQPEQALLRWKPAKIHSLQPQHPIPILGGPSGRFARGAGKAPTGCCARKPARTGGKNKMSRFSVRAGSFAAT